jgi:hypothetical protein
MDLLDLEHKVHLGLHYDNLESLIAECDALSTESNDLAVGYYVIGGVLKELMCDMDQQAVPSSVLSSLQMLLTPSIIASLHALRSGSKEASWTALNSLIRTWKFSDSGSAD